MHRMRALLAAVLASALGLPAQSLVLPTLADATTDQSQPTTNFGSLTELNFGKAYVSTPTFQVWFLRGHVAFDLTPIQLVGRIPVRATFNWYQSRSSAAGCLDVALHRVTAPWSEGSVTWQSQPTHDPLVTATACVGNSFSLGWKEFDVTLLVQDWLSGAVPNFGFVIRDPRESTAGAARPGFGHSRETGSPTLAPYLEVEFAELLGFGCSMRGAIPMADISAGAPRLGGSFTLTTVAAISGSTVGTLFGTSKTIWAGGSLPFDLTPLGLPYCNLYVSPDIAVTLGPISGGSWDLVVPLPNLPGLDGASLYMQTVALAPSGFETSNGVGVLLRR